MTPNSKMDHEIEKTFKDVCDLRNTNDFALFSSACCASNLEITGCMIGCERFSTTQASELRSMETMLRGYINSSAVLRQRIENTVELVCGDIPVPSFRCTLERSDGDFIGGIHTLVA